MYDLRFNPLSRQLELARETPISNVVILSEDESRQHGLALPMAFAALKG